MLNVFTYMFMAVFRFDGFARKVISSFLNLADLFKTLLDVV